MGEIVEVQGGHIVRSTGRKDRHSKVCTAKGPRDRRVRLSAHTAIQFYDVQDRLGYDRPSKAVDWLIKKAKAAIDELAELPTWNPTTATATTTRATRNTQQQEDQTSNERECQFSIENLAAAVCTATGSGSISNKRTIQTTKATKTAAPTTRRAVASHVLNMQERQQIAENRHYHHHHHHNRSSSFLPQSLDSDVIADTIKTFFPMGGSVDQTTSSSLQFQSYPPDLPSRTRSQTQDLRLSLQSFPEPIQQVLFSGTAAAQNALGFDGASVGWSEHHQQQGEESRFQRMVAWNANGTASHGDTGNGGGGGAGGGPGGGFMFNPPPPVVSPPQPPLLQPLFGETQLFSQRGPLQSSSTPSVRAWIDPAITVAHHHQFHEIPQINQDQSGISGIGFSFTSGGGGGFSQFCIPSRIQGEEEEHVGIPSRPSSASSDSHH